LFWAAFFSLRFKAASFNGSKPTKWNKSAIKVPFKKQQVIPRVRLSDELIAGTGTVAVLLS
jgi:hypothetical protein